MRMSPTWLLSQTMTLATKNGKNGHHLITKNGKIMIMITITIGILLTTTTIKETMETGSGKKTMRETTRTGKIMITITITLSSQILPKMIPKSEFILSDNHDYQVRYKL